MKFPIQILSAGCALAIAMLACARPQGPPTPRPPVDSVRALTHDGQERNYHIHIPKAVDLTRPVPLVMVFHGGGGKAQQAIRTTDFNELADDDGFIVVYPNGTGPRDVEVFTWNAGICCANAMLENADDVGFARAILKDMQTIASIDPKRVYATGMSNGAMMSYRLACEAADVFAAIAPVAGTLNYSPCAPSESVAVIHFHGTDDQHVLYNGGAGPESIVGVDFASVASSIGFWVAFNGCASQPAISQIADVRREVWGGCKGGAPVELYTIVGGQHAWPGSEGPGWVGGDEPSQTVSATLLIWDFFKANPK
ncbi:MAG: prolyl oligopeptidase family serine peptidase [Chloroflexi bacterium]|nr:prolyl oligopeptidase family serine peptidase [Chloroflexota bacterium]